MSRLIDLLATLNPRRLKFYAMLPGALMAAAPALGADEKPAASASQGDKVNFQDHVLPVFRNACLNCHNPDKKKAGLDLTTYAATLVGGDNGPVITAGDPGSSKLYKVITHAEEPAMPPKKDKLADKELEVVRKWIAAGMLENANGKAAIAVKPKVDLSVVATVGKPTGPIAMPKSVLSEPIVRTQRAGAVVSLATSPWAPVAAVGGQKQILLYHTQTLDLIGVLPFPEGLPQVLRFSRNGSVLLAGGGEAAKSGKVVLFDVNTGNRITEVGDELDSVIGADISADQSIVALGGPNRVVKGYAVADGKLIYTIKKHTDWVTAIAFSADGQLLATADRAGGISVWEADTGQEVHTLTGHREAVSALAFRDDSKLLASCSTDGTAKLWNMDDGKEFKSWAAHGTYRPPQAAVGAGTFDPAVGALSIAFTHDGRLVTTGRDRIVRTWDAAAAAGKVLEPKFDDVALSAAFDADGTRVIAGDWTGAVRVWNVADGKVAGDLTVNPPTIAERLDAAVKKLTDAKPALEKLTADSTAAQEAAAKAAAELQAIQSLIETSKKSIPEADAKAKAAAQTVAAATDAVKKSQAQAAEKQKEAVRLASAAQQVAQQADQGVKAPAAAGASAEVKAMETDLAQKQALLAEGEKRLAAANEAAKAKPDDATLKTAVEQAQGSVGRRTQRVADAKKALEVAKGSAGSKSPDGAGASAGAPANEAVAKAKAEADKAAEAAKVAQVAAEEAAKAAEKATADAKAATEALAKARADAEAATKAVAPKTEAARVAAEQAAKAKQAAETAAAQLKDLHYGVAKLKADQAGSAMTKATKDLDDQVAKQGAMKGELDAARAAAEKAAADATAFEKGLPEAPARLKAKQDAADKAKAAATAAKMALNVVTEDLKPREALAQQSADLAQKVAASAAGSKDNKGLAEAAEKAKSAADLLAADFNAVKQVATAKADEAKKAADTQTNAEAEMAKAKNDVDNGAKILADLKKAAADATAEVPKKQTALDGLAKPMEEAKAKIEQLKAEHERLRRDAEQLVTAAKS